MGKKMAVFAAVLGVVVLGSACMAGAQDAVDDLQGVYQDTSVFDGGPGSTINTSPAYEDLQQGRDPYDVPDVGEPVPVY